MKQYAIYSLSKLTFALGVGGVVVGCGGGQHDGSPMPAAVVSQTAASSVSATANAGLVSAPSSTSALPKADTAATATQPTAEPARPAATIAGPVLEAAPAAQHPAQLLSSITAELPITRAALLAFNADFTLPHEAMPGGVPSGYDWYANARAANWNTPPSGFTAITGWGQAFWATGTTTPSAHLLLKKHLTFICHGSQRQWSLVQAAGVEGSVFEADFSTNTATAAMAAGPLEAGSLALTFPVMKAYHFWPLAARAALPSGPLCGMLTMVQARAQPLTVNSYATPNLLLGMGADYWLNQTAPWDNYKTNLDAAIGRLKLVTTKWAWYGLSTASNADLERLFNNGFVVAN